MGSSGNSPRSSELAASAPASWAAAYATAKRAGNRPAVANPRLTAGFRWAAEMSPRAYTRASTTSPNVSATPGWVTAPVAAFTTTAPVPANTGAKVPTASAASRLRSGGTAVTAA